MNNKITQKDLAVRWTVSLRTVQRDVKRFDLEPVDYVGIQPVFDERDVRRMEQRRKEFRMKKAGYKSNKGRILSMKELRAIKKKAGNQ